MTADVAAGKMLPGKKVSMRIRKGGSHGPPGSF